MKRLVSHTDSGFGTHVREMQERLRNLAPPTQIAMERIVDANSSVNFDPMHPASHIATRPGRIEIGSRSAQYTALLTLNGDETARVFRDWVLWGRR